MALLPDDFVASYWFCDCPDWAKGEPIGLAQIYQVFPRAWEQSRAGAKGDCKHIMACRLAEGEKYGDDFGPYADPPLPYIPLPKAQ